MSSIDKPPKYTDCGSSDPHVCAIHYTERGEDHVRHVWLCGSCEYKREHPDALLMKPPPRAMRPAKLQSETLI